MRSLLMPLAVLVKPRRTFSELAGRARWVWSFALLFVLVTLVAKLAVGMPHMLELQDDLLKNANVGVSYSAESEGGGIKTPEARDAKAEGADEEVVVPEDVKATAATITTISSYVFGVLGVVFGALVLAGAIYGISRIWSKETPFVVVLGVVALAKMPDAVRNAVQTIYTAASGKWVQHQGLGTLAVPENIARPTVPYALLSLVDVYAIWFVVLLFLGMVYAMGLERRRAAIVTGAFVALGIVFAVVPTLLAGAFMPA